MTRQRTDTVCHWVGWLVLSLLLALAGPSLAQSPNGLETNVQVNGDVVSNAAGNGASASTRLGSSLRGKGHSSTQIDGRVITQSTGGASSTEIGGQDKSGSTTIRGNVLNYNSQIRATDNTYVGGDMTATNGASVNIGGCGSVHISGDVVVPNGDLEIGCGCAGRRNGQCCIEFHNGFCVLNMVPPSEDGCPPGYFLSEGLCRLYSDFSHRVGN